MAVMAGRYRHRIKIMKLSGEKDEYGAKTGNVLVAHPWCKVSVINEVEISADRTTGQELIEFEVRYSKSIENPTSDMHIVFKDRDFDIVSVLNVLELNEKLKILGKRR
jgi:head-tail adaptor